MSEITSISFCKSVEDFHEAGKNILSILEYWKGKKIISKQSGRVWTVTHFEVPRNGYFGDLIIFLTDENVKVNWFNFLKVDFSRSFYLTKFKRLIESGILVESTEETTEKPEL